MSGENIKKNVETPINGTVLKFLKFSGLIVKPEAKFDHFFNNNYICLELFKKRTLSKVIVRSILKDIINAST